MTEPIAADLRAVLPGPVVVDDLAGRLAWANDASIYLLVPRVVVIVRHAADVQAVLAVAARHRVPVCFRAGGTSLSGQAVTDGILVVVSRHLRGITVTADGLQVTAQPGAVGAWVNAALAGHGRRIGPDPASIQAAEIGGIVANNASGMCCGVHENSYQTVTNLDLILADGTAISTGAAEADTRLATVRPDLAAGLIALRDRVRADAGLVARIRRAFATKNTVGYSLNAFLDADTPAAILQRLVVGSEGTLAFIAAATFRTIPLPRFRATAWLMFSDVEAAGRAVAPLAAAGAAAVELLDAVALRRVAAKLPQPPPPGEPAALLVEFQDEEPFRLDESLRAARTALEDHGILGPVEFTTDAAFQAKLWAIRKGLFPSVGAVRAANTAVVIEDVTFPVPRLAEGVSALRRLFARHGYDDAVIFGHAKDGNLHFTLTPDLAQTSERDRYATFMAALVDLVLGMDGHLKAEHGTGRNMAPFVVRQWGEDAVAIMRAVKSLLDPLGILNPGILLSDDPESHLRHLKSLVPADPLVDRCIECGFCEPVCPSRDHTLSPRQRITALRTMAAGGAAGRAVRAVWRERGLDTCATDGLCATACPVGIDTGALVRAERTAAQPAWTRAAAGWIAGRVGLVASLARGSLRLAGALPGRRLPGRAVPLPPPARPRPAHWPQAETGAPTLLWLPSCVSRIMGPDEVGEALHRLCAAAGVGVVVVENADALCCGQPFSSKGYTAAHDASHARTRAALARSAATARGQSLDIVMVTDVSTCAAHLHDDPPVMDPATCLATILVPRLIARRRLAADAGTVAVHPTCADLKHGWDAALRRALTADGSPVVQPAAAGCCGMAGDRGWTEPGLTAAATAREAAAVRAASPAGGACSNPACALAIGAASGIAYQHPWALLAGRLIGR
ncbi:4Fe-4S ferredoxin [Planctomycetota bacterium]|nr:4Fe-4S ferredoxin [Planctomycetota bacterium]